MIIEPKIYMDADSIIDVLKHGLEIPIQDYNYKKAHIDNCQNFFKAAERRQLTLMTSSISLKEVWHLSEKPPPEEHKRIINAVLNSGQIFKIVNESIFITERARDLNWIHGFEFKAGDATHLASALEAGCVELLTNDRDFLNRKIEIQKLGILVLRASDSSYLPNEYIKPMWERIASEETDEEEKGTTEKTASKDSDS